MSLRTAVVLLAIAGLTVLLPAESHAQVYAGATFGAGGAQMPFNSDRSGFRGALRLYGGYEFNRHLAAEVMTLDLGTPRNRPTSTIGAFGVAVVGTLPVRRFRFTGRLGAMSMDGRAAGAETKRAGQAMLGLGAGCAATERVTIGLETAVSRVEFGSPLNDAARINWTAVGASFRF